MKDVKIVIVGGGLAGLISSIHLARIGIKAYVIEKKMYPFHRVCGEYISNEVVPYLDDLGCYPHELRPSQINRFELTSVNGRSASMPLDLGGFGVSRYAFDQYLYQKAQSLGVRFCTGSEVESIVYNRNTFTVRTSQQEHEADIVIGAFGKRSRLDGYLKRGFFGRRSPYVGVKYHIRLSGFADDLIALHNFKNGYCGISQVEDGRINLCYLTHRDNVKKYGNVRDMETQVLYQNPFLQQIFSTATFLFEKPEVINEISFETKSPVAHHILMAGDAAGMITPLCGNGMALAIHGAKVLSEHVIRYVEDKSYDRDQLEQDYTSAWNSLFSRRLWAGRQIQQLFGGIWSSNLAVSLANSTPGVARYLMKKTHGEPFSMSNEI
ncbi:MAG: NAD(P)/FAD-dependent oxidoreductase [Cyclobacteriaceae bacterium]|nr:FAD-dependent oxidoreductase [Cytophagales bacterium]HNP75967.1 NAD(P)/FAD-dependent oxidoreductase [Cyclobacteriaceae bacterium]